MNYIQETFLSSISLEWVASYGTKARLEFAVAPTQGNAAARRMFDGVCVLIHGCSLSLGTIWVMSIEQWWVQRLWLRVTVEVRSQCFLTFCMW